MLEYSLLTQMTRSCPEILAGLDSLTVPILLFPSYRSDGIISNVSSNETTNSLQLFVVFWLFALFDVVTIKATIASGMARMLIDMLRDLIVLLKLAAFERLSCFVRVGLTTLRRSVVKLNALGLLVGAINI